MVASEPELIKPRRRFTGRFALMLSSAFLVVGALLGISVLPALHGASSKNGSQIRTAADQTAGGTSDVDACVAQQAAATRSIGQSLPGGMIKVFDRVLGETTMDVRQYCSETLALAAPANSGIEASYYVANGQVAAEYYQVTTVRTADGSLQHTSAPQPLTDEQAQQILTQNRAPQSK